MANTRQPKIRSTRSTGQHCDTFSLNPNPPITPGFSDSLCCSKQNVFLNPFSGKQECCPGPTTSSQGIRHCPKFDNEFGKSSVFPHISNRPPNVLSGGRRCPPGFRADVRGTRCIRNTGTFEVPAVPFPAPFLCDPADFPNCTAPEIHSNPKTRLFV